MKIDYNFTPATNIDISLLEELQLYFEDQNIDTKIIDTYEIIERMIEDLEEEDASEIDNLINEIRNSYKNRVKGENLALDRFPEIDNTEEFENITKVATYFDSLALHYGGIN